MPPYGTRLSPKPPATATNEAAEDDAGENDRCAEPGTEMHPQYGLDTGDDGECEGYSGEHAREATLVLDQPGAV